MARPPPRLQPLQRVPEEVKYYQGKKHKKKVYTKPKKKKHIHVKSKLRILNYFKISEGKIEKLRRLSPEAPGCFMAEHFNRVTCGKTGLTFVRKI